MTLTLRDNAPTFAEVVALAVASGLTRHEAIMAAAVTADEEAHAAHGFAERWVECDLCDEEVGEPDDDDFVTYEADEPWTPDEQMALGLVTYEADPVAEWYEYMTRDAEAFA